MRKLSGVLLKDTTMKNHNKKLWQALVRQDFSSFIGKVFQTVNPGTAYEDNWHINLIADYLEAVRAGNIRRLIINMPPRALKSVCVSVAWPAWILAKTPEKRLMVASYSSILSVKHSLDCRFVMESEWYKRLFPGTILSKKHNQKSKFLTSCNGFRFATSVGGSATGEGGDILIIDDPHNPTHINSPKLRNKAIEWFEQSFVTRLNNKNTGAIILVMQRLHEHDLAGYLLAKGGWELLQIPAITDEDLHYQISGKNYFYPAGELLNIKRDKIEFLRNLEQEIGCKNFSAQFLQRPLPSNIALLALEDMSFYDSVPAILDYYILSWDTAIKISDSSDYSVCTCWGYSGGQYYLVDMRKEKLTYPELKNQAESYLRKYKPRYTLIEDKASGQSLVQDLILAGHNGITAIRPRQDKITRFCACVPSIQAGKVLFPKKARLKHDLLSELLYFPNSRHDDIVDSVSQFINFIKEYSYNRPPSIRRL